MKSPMTTISALNLMQNADYIEVVTLMQDAGYSETEVANILANAVNARILAEPSGFALLMLCRLGMLFIESLALGKLTYKLVGISKSGLTHYVKVVSDITSHQWLHVFFVQFCGEKTWQSGGEKHTAIMLSGCGYDKVFELHNSALNVLRTVGLLDTPQPEFDTNYKVQI